MVHHHEPGRIGLDPGRGQVQLCGPRRAAGGHQQPLPGHAPPARGDHHDLPAVTLNRGRPLAHHGDPIIEEHLAQRRGELGLGAWGQAAHEAHFRAEVGEQLGLLQPDIPAADDDQRGRQLAKLHRRGRGQVVHLGQPGQVRDRRLRPGRDQERRRRQLHAVDQQGVRIGERGHAVEDLKVVGGGDVGVLGLTQPADQLVLLLHQSREVHVTRRGGGAHERVVQRAVPGPCPGQQRLGRHTPDVDAGATQGAPLDDDHAGTQQPGVDRRGHRRPTRTDHGQINDVLRWCVHVLSLKALRA